MTVPLSRRIPVAPRPCPGNAGIRQRYLIDRASWIWHPGIDRTVFQVVEFALQLDLPSPVEWEFETSADQRYILTCDSVEMGRGPDRSELGGWSFHRYRLSLDAGKHLLRALAWWMPETVRPAAQVSAMPAFALIGDDEAETILSTGVADWKTRISGGWNLLPEKTGFSYHVIGRGFDIHGGAEDGAWRKPVTVAQGKDIWTGVLSTPWRCEPSPLPEQSRERYSGGSVRVVQNDHATQMESGAGVGTGSFSGLCRGETITIPAHSRMQILWDFEDYVCGYACLELEKGTGSILEVEWAESLYNSGCHGDRSPKGDRAACLGKHWIGFGDRIRHSGGKASFEPLWWRSGRWLRLKIETGKEPLLIHDARPLRTHFPYCRGWRFSADASLEAMLTVCENGLLNSVHETFVDCPYYEQMQYVGDTRVQALVWRVASGDPAPVRRALELFDRSRWVNGFVAERCPTREPQMSSTYSLIQPLMLRDFMLWNDDRAFIRSLLPGTRSALEHALASLDEDGLPSFLPGWLFVDWVPRPFWKQGVPGGHTEALTAPIALHLPLALWAAAEIEEACGEELMARRWKAHAADAFTAIMTAFWDPRRNMLADDREATAWSEHAQALALASPTLDPDRRAALTNALVNPTPDMAPASVYFSYYVHEALLLAGRVDALLERFSFWKDLPRQGFLTTVEKPEPSRSDCHGWGAHPLYHCLTGLAGIRPAGPGFHEVHITPQPAGLEHIKASLPHPKGLLSVDLRFAGTRVSGTIETPVPGSLYYLGRREGLQPGTNEL